MYAFERSEKGMQFRMNEVFIIGKIVEEVKFDFIINNKKKAIAKSAIELNNGSVIEIVGFDKVADFMYGKLRKNKQVFIYGKIIKNNLYIKRIVLI